MYNWTLIIDTLMDHHSISFDQVFEQYDVEQMLMEYARIAGDM